MVFEAGVRWSETARDGVRDSRSLVTDGVDGRSKEQPLGTPAWIGMSDRWRRTDDSAAAATWRGDGGHIKLDRRIWRVDVCTEGKSRGGDRHR